jgi:hypothetical protein
MFRRVAAAPMHLKRYQIDGRLLRSDAANFSASGLKRQDNDLIVIESGNAAVEFKHAFDARFDSGEALPRSTRQWRMDHPRVLGLLIVAVYLFKRLDAHLEKHNPFDCRIYHELSEGEEDPYCRLSSFYAFGRPALASSFSKEHCALTPGLGAAILLLLGRLNPWPFGGHVGIATYANSSNDAKAPVE